MFDNLVVAYLFLGGTGAGLFAVMCVLCLMMLSDRRSVSESVVEDGISVQRFFSFGFIFVTLACVLGALCLLFDMRRPEALLTMLLHPAFTVVAIGAYSLGLLIAISALLAAFWAAPARVSSWVCRVLCLVGIALALVTMVYTALLLQVFPLRYFFQPVALIAVFLLSSLSCGCNACLLSMVVLRVHEDLRWIADRLRSLDIGLIVCELLTVLWFLVSAYGKAPEQVLSLLCGAYSHPFWLGVVVVGLAVPLAILCVERFFKRPMAFILVPAMFVLTGGFFLRWCILAAA